MGTFSELSMTENPIGEAFISEASISKASDAAVGDVSPHSAPTDVTADDICTSKAPTIDAPTETPAHNVASSDVAIYEPSAHQVTSAPSESTAPSKKTRRGRNDPEPDWSARMREKVKKSKNRIGQACDRCKAKKMRCTPDHNGCASCISQNLPCRVTDPVTGQTYVRGEAGRMRQVIDRLNEQAETLRREITRLQQENELLQSSHMDLKSQLSLYKSSLNTYDAEFVLGHQDTDMMHLM